MAVKNIVNNTKPKVFFIADKWCAGNKKFGISEWENNLATSLRSTNIADVETFHFDEHHESTGQKADKALLERLRAVKPDMVCLVIYNMPGSAVNVPEFSTLQHIKEHLKIPMLAVWGDLEIPEQVKISKALLPYVEFNMATASSAALERIGKLDKYMYMWVPKDSVFFNNPDRPRDIDVGYVGSPKKDRLARLMHLRNNGINVVFGGGERDEHLSIADHALTYQRTKIAVSFARAHVSHVVNARPFEAMLCGAMLLEQESFEMAKLYIPYVDYIPYTNDKDLLEKTRYYLSHESERKAIADSGYKKTWNAYSAIRFWTIAIEKTLKGTPTESYDFEYRLQAENLAKLSRGTAIKLRFIDWMCSHSFTFFIYKLFDWRFWQAILFAIFKKARKFLEKRVSPATLDKLLKIKRKVC